MRGDEGVSRMSNAARSIAAAGAALGGRTIRRVILASAAIPFGHLGTLICKLFWCQSIKMYDFYTPRLAPNGSDYIAQNASKRGFLQIDRQEGGGAPKWPKGHKSQRHATVVTWSA